jgi:hypothetical protein
MSHIEPGPWRHAAADLGDPGVTAALIVQCGLDWPRPPLYGLRDEIDDAVMNSLLAREDLSVDRVVLHSVPMAEDLERGELAALNAAYRAWLSRLAVSGALLPESRRPRVHRLIVASSQRSVGDMDCAEVRINGTWSDPDAVAAVLAMRDAGATTPLTSYDIETDGPYGDADPSVYL